MLRNSPGDFSEELPSVFEESRPYELHLREPVEYPPNSGMYQRPGTVIRVSGEVAESWRHAILDARKV